MTCLIKENVWKRRNNMNHYRFCVFHVLIFFVQEKHSSMEVCDSFD